MKKFFGSFCFVSKNTRKISFSYFSIYIKITTKFSHNFDYYRNSYQDFQILLNQIKSFKYNRTYYQNNSIIPLKDIIRVLITLNIYHFKIQKKIFLFY